MYNNIQQLVLGNIFIPRAGFNIERQTHKETFRRPQSYKNPWFYFRCLVAPRLKIRSRRSVPLRVGMRSNHGES